MMVKLIEITRDNALGMIRLELKPEQRGFVSPPGWSFARVYTKYFGDEFEHTPRIIDADGTTVGYATIACNPTSAEDYWIDDIMIDQRFQGHGYGRAAMVDVLKSIVARYPKCRAIQLTCFRANTVAAKLYLSIGFVPTGGVDGEFGEPNYILKDAALDRYRA